MKKSISMFRSWVLSILLVLFLIGPANAARYEDLTVGKLTVEKTAAIQGLVQAAANTTGKGFYVHNGTGINAIGRGTDSTKPFASVDFAINQARASKGDFIIVMPGHAESFTAANGFDADVAGITILGLGDGAARPTFTFADTDADIAIGAASVTIANIRFKAGISDIVRGISVEAAGDDFTMIGCDFPVPGTATFEFLEAILLASGADNATFKYNTYRDGASSAANTWINADAGIVVNPRFIGNDVFGRFAVAPIHSSRADTGVLLADNVIGNTISGQFAVEFTAAATGMAINNRLYSDAIATVFDPGSLICVGNLAATAIDTSGVSIPVGGSSDAVLGAMNDAAATGAVTDADTAMAYIKQLVTELQVVDGYHDVPTADVATNTTVRDVVGNKTDAAATVAADKSIMANVKQVTNQGQKIDSATLAVNPTAGSLARFVASGGTALGTPLADSKSLVDALGTNGTTPVDSATSVLGAIGVNDADNVMDTSAVVANRDGSLYERSEYAMSQIDKIDSVTLAVSPTAGSLARYVASGGTALGTPLGDSKSLVDAIGFNGVVKATPGAGNLIGVAGAPFVIKKALTSSAVVQAGVDVTAVAAGGDIVIDDIIIQTNATGLAAGTNFTLEKDAGTGLLTFFGETVANLGANKTENLTSGSVVVATGPIVLESGQKIVAKCTVADCTGAGTITLWIKGRRGADGATLTAAP
jgi:hypothetical protein